MIAAELRAKYQAKQRLAEVIGRPNEVLMHVSTVLPFFPDTICVTRSQLTVSHRQFFQVAQTVSVQIEDILDVIADVGPVFGSIRVSTRFFDNRKPFHISWLWREDALRLKRIAQGYMIARNQHVDTSALSAKELAGMLDKIGAGMPNEGR